MPVLSLEVTASTPSNSYAASDRQTIAALHVEKGLSPLLGTFTGGNEGIVHVHGQGHAAPLHQLPHTQSALPVSLHAAHT